MTSYLDQSAYLEEQAKGSLHIAKGCLFGPLLFMLLIFSIGVVTETIAAIEKEQEIRRDNLMSTICQGMRKRHIVVLLGEPSRQYRYPFPYDVLPSSNHKYEVLEWSNDEMVEYYYCYSRPNGGYLEMAFNQDNYVVGLWQKERKISFNLNELWQ